jgi:serine protein kinase
MSYQPEIQTLIEKYTRDSAYQELHWEGTMAQYLETVGRSPEILRNAFQRIYDMIISYGIEEYTENKEKLFRYKFFSDPENGGKDAVYGLEKPLMHLVNIFKSASRHYGTERRVLLLHGPVGSAKSTIVRLLKKGLETYSRTREGAVYTFAWHLTDERGEEVAETCPMHEEPLHLVSTRV